MVFRKTIGIILELIIAHPHESARAHVYYLGLIGERFPISSPKQIKHSIHQTDSMRLITFFIKQLADSYNFLACSYSLSEIILSAR